MAVVETPLSGSVGQQIRLDARGSLSEGGSTFGWRQVAGPQLEFADAGSAAATVVAEAPGRYAFEVTDDERTELEVEIRTRLGDKGERLVAVIEVLSLTNKTPGEKGRDLYLEKQREIGRLVEEEKNTSEILALMAMAGETGPALVMLDRQLGARSAD